MPDGTLIFFMMKNDNGIVQIFGVSPNGGDIRQFTHNNFNVETTFSISPDGKYIAYGSNQKVYLTPIESGETKQISPDPDKGATGLSSIVWSNDGKMLAYNRVLKMGGKNYNQIFILR